MAHKQVLFHSAAREKILHGTTPLADAVRVTLGPKSKSVLIQKKWGAPIVCNDGVTIAKEVDLKDPEENLGAQMLRQAAEKTGEAVGDGTSTSTILAQAIFADGTRNVVAGASAIDIKRGLDRGLRIAVEALRAMSRPVKTRKEKAQVATISAHNDPSIGELVADAMEKVGDEGVITVEESRPPKPCSRWSKGCSSTGGSSRRISSPMQRRWRRFLRMRSCCVDHKSAERSHQAAGSVAKCGSPILVVAEDVEGEALATSSSISPRHLPELRRQGTRLRRSPQGHAAGYRGAHRRTAHFRGSRAQTRKCHDGAVGACEADSR